MLQTAIVDMYHLVETGVTHRPVVCWSVNIVILLDDVARVVSACPKAKATYRHPQDRPVWSPARSWLHITHLKPEQARLAHPVRALPADDRGEMFVVIRTLDRRQAYRRGEVSHSAITRLCSDACKVQVEVP
jgi:hypothetical protein